MVTRPDEVSVSPEGSFSLSGCVSGVGSGVEPAVGGVGGAADDGATRQNQTGSGRAAESAAKPDPAAAGVLQEIPGETPQGRNSTVVLVEPSRVTAAGEYMYH